MESSPNESGKSTLWDDYHFVCLTSVQEQSERRCNELSKMNFDCKFEFELNGVEYFIERKAKKSPKEEL